MFSRGRSFIHVCVFVWFGGSQSQFVLVFVVSSALFLPHMVLFAAYLCALIVLSESNYSCLFPSLN